MTDTRALPGAEQAGATASTIHFQIGELVERRDSGDDWDLGYIISLQPLKVTDTRNPKGQGFEWDDVRRRIPEEGMPCSARRAAVNDIVKRKGGKRLIAQTTDGGAWILPPGAEAKVLEIDESGAFQLCSPDGAKSEMQSREFYEYVRYFKEESLTEESAARRKGEAEEGKPDVEAAAGKEVVAEAKAEAPAKMIGLVLSWAYADTNPLAKINPMRWSRKKDWDSTLNDISIGNPNCLRPLFIREYSGSTMSKKYHAKSIAELQEKHGATEAELPNVKAKWKRIHKDGPEKCQCEEVSQDLVVAQ
jgi:hypothetical protein